MAKSKQKPKNETENLVECIVKAIQEKHGKNITILDLQKIENRVFDYFVICEGNSRTQIEALFESVDRSVKQNFGYDPYSKEGLENAEWVLIDYIDVVVHIFQEKTRKFYNLESLWADAEVKEIIEVS